MAKSKEVFLRDLRQALSGQVPPETVRENLHYYEDYIREEVRNGRTERQVVEELGDAWLIARTVIQVTPGSGEGAYEEYESEFWDARRQSAPKNNLFFLDFSKWYGKALLLVAVILTLAVIFMVIGGILTLVVWLFPVILVGILVIWLMEKIFRK